MWFLEKKLWRMWENIEISSFNNRSQKDQTIVNKTSFIKLTSHSIKRQIFINERAYLGLSILEITKIVMCEFCYDYVKRKHGKKAKLC